LSIGKVVNTTTPESLIFSRICRVIKTRARGRGAWLFMVVNLNLVQYLRR
jgi:hypothetical protein